MFIHRYFHTSVINNAIDTCQLLPLLHFPTSQVTMPPIRQSTRKRRAPRALITEDINEQPQPEPNTDREEQDFNFRQITEMIRLQNVQVAALTQKVELIHDKVFSPSQNVASSGNVQKNNDAIIMPNMNNVEPTFNMNNIAPTVNCQTLNPVAPSFDVSNLTNNGSIQRGRVVTRTRPIGHHINESCKANIVKNKFVEFGDLLEGAKEKREEGELVWFLDKNNNLKSKRIAKQSKKLTFAEWCAAWNTYSAILCRHRGDPILYEAMPRHFAQVQSLYQEGNDWHEYDREFRLALAKDNSELSWGETDLLLLVVAKCPKKDTLSPSASHNNALPQHSHPPSFASHNNALPQYSHPPSLRHERPDEKPWQQFETPIRPSLAIQNNSHYKLPSEVPHGIYPTGYCHDFNKWVTCTRVQCSHSHSCFNCTELPHPHPFIVCKAKIVTPFHNRQRSNLRVFRGGGNQQQRDW